MFQSSLVTRLGALLLGANLALANSVWAAAPAGQHAPPVAKKQSTAKNKPSPLPAKPRVSIPTQGKAPHSIARPFEPVKPSGTTGKSLVSHGGPITGSSDSSSQSAPLAPATIGKKPADTRSNTGAGKGKSETIPFSQPTMRQATNPLFSRLKDLQIGEQPKLGQARDLNKDDSHPHSAKGSHDVHKSTNAAGRTTQQTSGTHSSTAETGGSTTASRNATSREVRPSDGTAIIHYDNGDTSYHYTDGSTVVRKSNGQTIASDGEGNMVVHNPDGSGRIETKNGTKTYDSDGNLVGWVKNHVLKDKDSQDDSTR